MARAQTKLIADRRVGRIQRQARRCLIAAGRPVTITDLLRYCYPHPGQFRMWHRTNGHRAVRRFAVEAGRLRSPRHTILWTLKAQPHSGDK